MNLLDRLLEHDAWTTRQLLVRCKDLTDEQLDREFDIAHRTVRATLQHIIFNVEVWSALMAQESVQLDLGARLEERSVEAFAGRLDIAAARLANVAHEVAQRGAWDERWVDVLDQPPTEKTYGGAITHVITHSMHHRAQLLYMLRRLGLNGLPEGDVLSWERQLA